jgi:hypothetical protein
MKYANVSWWKGSLEVGVDYRAKNTSPDQSDSIDYNRFSVVCSNGIKFHQAKKEVTVNGTATGYPGMYSFAPGATLDTVFLFYSVGKYSKKEGMNVLKHERLFLRYSDGTMDTLLSVVASDSKIR